MALEENIRNKTVGFSKTEISFGIGEDSCCILPTVLEHRKAVVKQLIHVRAVLANNSENAAHAFASYQLN
jgi:hypothetical protein